MKYIISWDTGYGDSYEIVEAKSEDAAMNLAYEEWKAEAESNAVYRAQEWSEELEEELM